MRKQAIPVRITESPKIDGILNEELWQNAALATNFTERNPKNGKPEEPGYETVVRIAYDDTGIYIGAEMRDPHPENIKKQLTERDDIGNDDFFGVSINGYNDHQQAMMFIVQASGVQADSKIFTNANDDYSWNGVWYSAVKIHEMGWTAEMKIPYSELRFPKKEVQDWGVNFMRNIQKNNQDLTWNFVDNTKGTYMLYDGVFAGMNNIQTAARLSFMPYFSTYLNNYDGKTTANVNGGMDLKYGISDAFTLDLTLIPDFGQANFDNAVLNLGPFEEYYEENRSFFTEGTELFNKGGLFYSRRIGGAPSRQPQLNGSEIIVENPDKVKLFNAVKVSGRTSKGLGIGFFNGVTEKMQATIRDEATGDLRKEVVEPWSNYNVLVLDQRFGVNSSVSFVNTNVTRNGDFRDANVSAALFNISNKKNTYNVYGNVKESIVHDGEYLYGTEAQLGAAKTAGAHRFGGNANFRTKNYDIDDLGYTSGANYLNANVYYNYRYLQPKGLLNILNYRVNFNLHNRMEPFLYRDFAIHQNLEMQDRKFRNFGIGLFVIPFKQNDIYEPRAAGRYLVTPPMMNPWIWMNSDERKKVAFSGFTEIYLYDESGRDWHVMETSVRYRVSDHFYVKYGLDYDLRRNDIGYAGSDDENIYMGRRNRKTFVNTLSSQYTFNDKMALNFSFRHYYSTVAYNGYYELEDDGLLRNTAYTAQRDGTYNFWNIDLRYSWWFAPGSQLTLLYRNAMDSYLEIPNPKFRDNFDYLFGKPQLNTLSLKVTYYLDYNRVKHWVTKKAPQNFETLN